MFFNEFLNISKYYQQKWKKQPKKPLSDSRFLKHYLNAQNITF